MQPEAGFELVHDLSEIKYAILGDNLSQESTWEGFVGLARDAWVDRNLLLQLPLITT
jgi:hypothetical protein